ncbi:MAG TPA: GAF domain-containing protein, partial [Herpetosiphonaceae bacterium]
MTGLNPSLTGSARSITGTLHDIAQALASAHDAEGRVRQVLALLQHVLPYDSCVLLEAQAGQPPRLLAVPETLPEQAMLRIELIRLLRWLREQASPALTDYGREVAVPLPWPSFLIVPLVRLDQVGGLLLVGHAAPAVYGSEDLSMLAVVAAQLAAYRAAMHDACDHQQAEATLQQYAHRLELLHQVSQAVRTMQPPIDFAQEALNRICQLLPCDAARLMLFDFDTAEAHTVALSIDGQTAAPHPARISLAHISYLGVLGDGNVYLASNTTGDGHLPQVGEGFQQDRGSCLCAPLQAQGTLLGSLELLADRPAAFDPDQV